MKYLAFVLAVLVIGCRPSIQTPEQLVGEMREAYSDTFFKTLTFTQKTVHTNQDGTRNEETWYESYKAPGNLSIRFGSVDSENGILFSNDSVFSFEAGTARAARPLIHPLLLLGFDVYTLPVEQTVAKLTTLGFDMSVLSEGMWKERPVYIVGAMAGDDTTKQFWVDQERLVLVRTLEPRMRMMIEVQFDDYQQVDGSWVGAEVLFLRDGEIVTEEYYSDLKANVDIDDREFDPLQWMYVTSPVE